MGALAITLAILAFTWVFAIVNDPGMSQGNVPLLTGLIASGLFLGALATGIAAAVIS